MEKNTSARYVVVYVLLDVTNKGFRFRYVDLYAFCHDPKVAEERAREIAKQMNCAGTLCLPRIMVRGEFESDRSVLDDADELFRTIVADMNAVSRSVTR